MARLIGTFWSTPRIVLPAAIARGWKQDAPWVRRRAAADRSKAVLSPLADGFALSKTLGAVGWLPSPTGGIFVGWLDAQRSGTGVLADAKLAAIVAALRPSRWRRLRGTVRGAGSHVVGYTAITPRGRNRDWLELELPAGDYAVDAVAAHKTPLGKLAFVRLTRAGASAATPARIAPAPRIERAPVLTWIATDGGPILALPEAACASWRGPGDDYERACEAHEVLLLRTGDATAIVLGHRSAAWLPTGPRVGVLVQEVVGDSKDAVVRAAVANASRGRWRRVGHLDVGAGALVLHDAIRPGAKPGRRRVRFTLPRGRYLIEHRRAATDEAEVSLVRLRG